MFLQDNQRCTERVKDKCILLKLNCNFKCVSTIWHFWMPWEQQQVCTCLMGNVGFWNTLLTLPSAVKTTQDLSALEAHSLVFKNGEWWDWVASFFIINWQDYNLSNKPSQSLIYCGFCKPIRHKKIVEFWCNVILLLQRFLCFLDDKSSLPYTHVGFPFPGVFGPAVVQIGMKFY